MTPKDTAARGRYRSFEEGPFSKEEIAEMRGDTKPLDSAVSGDMRDSIEFAKQLGKFPFIATRKRDGYRYVAVAPGADREEARAAVVAEYDPKEWDVTDAERSAAQGRLAASISSTAHARPSRGGGA